MDRKTEFSFVAIKAMEGFGLSWWNSTYVLFLTFHGLLPWEINSVNLVFMFVSTLIDPLTGKLADIIGQRPVYIMSLIFWCISTFTYGFATVFPAFLMAEILAAFGRTLSTDALESWLYNRGDSQKARASGGKWRSYTGIPAAICGSLLANEFGLQWPWFAASATLGLMILPTCYFLYFHSQEPKQQELEVLNISILECFKNSWRVKDIRLAIIITVTLNVAFQPFNMFWALIMKEASGEMWWLGFMWIPVSILFAEGFSYTRKLEVVEESHLVKLTAGLAITMCCAGISSQTLWLPGIVILFALHEFPRGALKSMIFTFANKHIANHERSTMNSIRSASETSGAVLGLVFFGALTLLVPVQTTWLVSGIMLIALTTWVWWQTSVVE